MSEELKFLEDELREYTECRKRLEQEQQRDNDSESPNDSELIAVRLARFSL